MCGRANGTYLYLRMTFSGFSIYFFPPFQHPKLTKKSLLHDVYVSPKSMQLSFS